jgi:hypothetical protein
MGGEWSDERAACPRRARGCCRDGVDVMHPQTQKSPRVRVCSGGSCRPSGPAYSVTIAAASFAMSVMMPTARSHRARRRRARTWRPPPETLRIRADSQRSKLARPYPRVFRHAAASQVARESRYSPVDYGRDFRRLSGRGCPAWSSPRVVIAPWSSPRVVIAPRGHRPVVIAVE